MRQLPSGLGTRRTGAPYGDVDGCIYPSSIISFNLSFSVSISLGLNRYGDRDGGVLPGNNSIRKSKSRRGGNSLGNCEGKTSTYWVNNFLIMVSVSVSLCSSSAGWLVKWFSWLSVSLFFCYVN